MNDLFGTHDQAPLTAPIAGVIPPLAERMRPVRLELVVGQEHLTGPNGPLFQMTRIGRPSSIIFWGGPGCGKTTIAQLLADHFDLRFVQVSAIESGVADLRKAFEAARSELRNGGRPTLLFCDEIHRFNKSQQDSFLPHVENGSIILVGATTESPSFSLNNALLSRTQVLTLRPLDTKALETILSRAEEAYTPLPLLPEARQALIHNAGGDARFMLSQAEILMGMPANQPVNIEQMGQVLSQRVAKHDRAGDGHYNLASAFQKSIRGSDPDAALYYAARMVDAGEDVAFIWRRLIVTASEEVGMADPTALQTVIAARQAFDMLGFPEGGHALGQAIIHVATAPKSNAAYKAWGEALNLAQKTRHIEPPKRILNAPTKLYEQEGYKASYQYDHDHPNAFSGQDFWPDALGPQNFYRPNPRGLEVRIQERLDRWGGIRAEKRRSSTR